MRKAPDHPAVPQGLNTLLAMIFSRTRYRDKQGRDWSPTGGDPDKGIIHLSHPDSDTGMDVKLSTLLNTFEVIHDESHDEMV